MELSLAKIPEEGLELTAATPKDHWFAKIVKDAFREAYTGKSAWVSLYFIKTGVNVSVNGSAEVDLSPTCDRCLEVFSRRLNVPIELVLVPAREIREPDDVNFSFYRGEKIAVGDFVREFLVLAVPLRFLCKADCKGICPSCGKNLNQGGCSCDRGQVDPRFAVLKNFKPSH